MRSADATALIVSSGGVWNTPKPSAGIVIPLFRVSVRSLSLPSTLRAPAPMREDLSIHGMAVPVGGGGRVSAAYRETMRATAASDPSVRIVAPGVYFVETRLVNWTLLSGDGTITLIDAGYPRDLARIQRVIRSIDGELTTILVTHGHTDHIGAIRGLLAERRPSTFWRHPMSFRTSDVR